MNSLHDARSEGETPRIMPGAKRGCEEIGIQ